MLITHSEFFRKLLTSNLDMDEFVLANANTKVMLDPVMFRKWLHLIFSPLKGVLKRKQTFNI